MLKKLFQKEARFHCEVRNIEIETRKMELDVVLYRYTQEKHLVSCNLSISFSVENRRNHHSSCHCGNVFSKNDLQRDDLGSLIYSLGAVNISAKHAN